MDSLAHSILIEYAIDWVVITRSAAYRTSPSFRSGSWRSDLRPRGMSETAMPDPSNITRLTKRGTIALKQVQKESKQAKIHSLGRLSRVYGNTLWSSPLSGGKMKQFRLPCYLSFSVLGTKARTSSVFFLSSIFEIRTYKDHRSLSPSKNSNPLPVKRVFRNFRALLNVAVLLYTIPPNKHILVLPSANQSRLVEQREPCDDYKGPSEF